MTEQVAGESGTASSATAVVAPFGGLLLSWTVRPGGAVLIEVDGVLDAESSSRFAELVRDRVTDTTRGLVLDLSRLSFIDTHGVVVMTEAAHRARVRGTELVLVSGNRIVDRLLSVLELDDWFGRADSVSVLDRPGGSGIGDAVDVPIPRQATGPAVHREP